MAGNNSSVRTSSEDLDLEQLELCVRKALGVAMALSERSGDEHDRFAAEAIVDNLHEAKEILVARACNRERREDREAGLH